MVDIAAIFYNNDKKNSCRFVIRKNVVGFTYSLYKI